jgi:hypothetical protein
VAEVAGLLIKGWNRYEIHKKCCPQYDRDWHQIDIYISRAKELLREQSKMTPEDAKALGVGVLFRALRKGGNQSLAAERRLGEIFGYDAPRRAELTGVNGGPLELLAGARPFKGLTIEELEAEARRIINERNIVQLPALATTPTELDNGHSA